MRRRSMSIIFMTCSLSLVYVIVLNCFITRLSERETSKSLIQLADARGYSQTVFYGLQRDDRTPEFYAPDRVVYGDDGEPILFEGPAQAFNESRKRQAAILVFVRLRDLNELTALKQIQSEVIGNNGKYGIVAIRAR
jgi:hypothetical protein